MKRTKVLFENVECGFIFKIEENESKYSMASRNARLIFCLGVSIF